MKGPKVGVKKTMQRLEKKPKTTKRKTQADVLKKRRWGVKYRRKERQKKQRKEGEEREGRGKETEVKRPQTHPVIRGGRLSEVGRR